MPIRVYAIIIGLYSVQQSVLQEGYRKGGKEGRREKEREREMKREQERFSVISMLSHGLKKTIGKLLVCIFFPDTKAIYAYCTELGNFKKHTENQTHYTILSLYLSVVGDIISSPTASKPYAYEFT